MVCFHPTAATKEKPFFSLSPLPTSRTVMLRDLGSRDFEVIARVWEGSPLLLCGTDPKAIVNLQFPVEMIRPHETSSDG